MNKNPTVIQPGLLAIDVLKIMCAKNPPFNLMPVVDNNGNAVGLVRMLDFVAAGVTL
jgi:CBS domain-containing protein